VGYLGGYLMRLDRKAGLIGLGIPDLRTLFENVDYTLI
jgi:hypothetical protein